MNKAKTHMRGQVLFTGANIRNCASISLLCIFASLFYSCDRDDIPDINREKPEIETGEPVVVNFTMREIGYGENDVTLRNAASPSGGMRGGFSPIVLEEQYIPLTPPSGKLEESSIYMSVTLTEDEPPVKLRTAEPLHEDVKVRVVAYMGVGLMGDTINAGYADYEVVSGGLLNPITHPLMVPVGPHYKFVAYSYQDADPIPIFADTTTQVNSFDVMWGDTTATITPGHTSVQIQMRHLYSQVKMRATLDSIVVGNTINSFTSANVSSFNPRLVVQTGQFTLNGATTMGLFPISGWSTPYSVNGIISDSLFVYTNGTAPRIEFYSVTIDGTEYIGPYTVNFSTPLVAGKSYSLHVNFILADGSADILYFAADGTLSVGKWRDGLITSQNMAYFTYGGVIGFKAPAPPPATQQWSTGLIIFNPSTHNPTNYFANNGTGLNFYSTSNDWKNDGSGVVNISNSNYHNGTNIKNLGKGDPCKLVGLRTSDAQTMTPLALEQWNSGWRMAKADENVDFVRAPSSFLGSIATPPISLNGTNAFYASYTPSGTDFGGWFPLPGNREASTNRTPRSNNTYGFLPVSGRYTHGGSGNGNPAPFNGITEGFYWASDVQQGSTGYALSFTSSTVTPRDRMNFYYGQAVRCVRNPGPYYY